AKEARVVVAPAAADPAGGVAAGPADRAVAHERAVVDVEGAGVVQDGPAKAVAGARGRGAGFPANRLIVQECAVAHSRRSRRGRRTERRDGPTEPGTARKGRRAVAAGRAVTLEAGMADGQGSRVEDAAAKGVRRRGRAGKPYAFIVGHDSMGEGQRTVVPNAAASQEGVSVGDGQVFDTHRHAATGLEDPAGVVTADGQPVSTRTVDSQIVR